MTPPLRVLCVCTHNRTRSVMTGGLLKRHLTRMRVDTIVDTAGTMSVGEQPMDPAVRLLAKRGIDVSGHRSQLLDHQLVEDADLIITAERDHVVWIAGRWPAAFASTFTLPEVVARAEHVEPRNGGPVGEWLARLGAGRATARDYLDIDVGEIADPTGQSPAVWGRAFAQIDELTRQLAVALT